MYQTVFIINTPAPSISPTPNIVPERDFGCSISVSLCSKYYTGLFVLIFDSYLAQCSILWLQIKKTVEAVWGKYDCLEAAPGDCRTTGEDISSILSCCIKVPIPPKYPLWQLACNVQNSFSLVVDEFLLSGSRDGK